MTTERDDLISKNQNANDGLLYVVLAYDVVIILIISGVIVYKWLKKGQTTTKFIWVQIWMLWASYVFFTVRDYLRMIGIEKETNEFIFDYQESNLVNIMGCLSNDLYTLQHSVFAISYFRIAISFKLVFHVESEKAQLALRNLLLWTYVIGFFFLFMVSAMPWIVFIFIGHNSKIYDIFNMVNFNLIVALLSFSIYRIRKYSKMLVQSNIFANECLMLSHLASFTWLTILITIEISL